MRPLLLNLIVVVLAAASGYGLCAIANWDPHPREMLLAATGCLIAAELGTLPVVLWRAQDAGAASQAGLVGTLVHLMIALGFAGAVVVIRKPHVAFIYWVMVFYWTTLVSVVYGMIRAVKSADRHAKATPAH